MPTTSIYLIGLSEQPINIPTKHMVGLFSTLATAWKNGDNNLNWTPTTRPFAMQSLTLWSRIMVTVVGALSILPDWVQLF